MAWTDEVIRRGDKGELVENVQKGLLELGYDCGPADGIFGRKTRDAIQAFQGKHGLDADGICGPNTGKKLEEVYWAQTKAVKAKEVVAKAAPKGAPVKGKK